MSITARVTTSLTDALSTILASGQGLTNSKTWRGHAPGTVRLTLALDTAAERFGVTSFDFLDGTDRPTWHHVWDEQSGRWLRLLYACNDEVVKAYEEVDFNTFLDNNW